MREGKNIPIWFNEEDRRRVQEGAALAGYRQLSKYIRDRALGKHGEGAEARSDAQGRAERQAIEQRLAGIEESLASIRAMLAMVLALVRQRATTGEVGNLLVALEGSNAPEEALTSIAPELAAVLGGQLDL